MCVCMYVCVCARVRACLQYRNRPSHFMLFCNSCSLIPHLSLATSITAIHILGTRTLLPNFLPVKLCSILACPQKNPPFPYLCRAKCSARTIKHKNYPPALYHLLLLLHPYRSRTCAKPMPSCMVACSKACVIMVFPCPLACPMTAAPCLQMHQKQRWLQWRDQGGIPKRQ
jgi:hypothetical protein